MYQTSQLENNSSEVEGMSELKEIKISYKHTKRRKKVPPIQHSKDAYNAIIKGFNLSTIALQEQVVVLYLSRANKPLGVLPISCGGLTGTICDIRLVLAVALKVAATAIILAHNHPSGNLTPSIADKELTNKVSEAAAYMEIKLLDHIIVSPEGSRYYSFADSGL